MAGAWRSITDRLRPGLARRPSVSPHGALVCEQRSARGSWPPLSPPRRRPSRGRRAGRWGGSRAGSGRCAVSPGCWSTSRARRSPRASPRPTPSPRRVSGARSAVSAPPMPRAAGRGLMLRVSKSSSFVVVGVEQTSPLTALHPPRYATSLCRSTALPQALEQAAVHEVLAPVRPAGTILTLWNSYSAPCDPPPII